MNPLEDDEDPWPDEPDEFDPDSVGPETPDVEPEVDVPSVDSFGAAADVDEDIFRAFWGSVVFLNVAIAALAVGAMLVYFRGDWSTGGPALLIGALSAAFVGRFYLTYLSARGGDGAPERSAAERSADLRPADEDAPADGGRPADPADRDDGAGTDR